MAKEMRMPSVGDTLKGVYQLQGVLGEGGFAKAFLGKDVEKNVQVAVKVLKLSSAREILHFSLEAYRMQKLTHPNIVKVTDYDAEEDSLPYLVMPLAPNGSLRSEIKARRGRGEQIPLERNIAVIEQIGDALEYLHQKRIVHQDVKPDNILLPNETDFWLSDFGIAKILTPSDPLVTGGFRGTPVFAAPEQFIGKAVFASDQHSLAVLAYYLLTGNYPFTSIEAEMRGFKNMDIKPPTLLEAVQRLNLGESMTDVLRALNPVVQKAIAKEPEDRYDTVMTFARTLKKTAEDVAGEKPKGKPFQGVDMPQKKDEGQKQRETTPTVPLIEEIIKRCVELFSQEKYVEVLQASEQAIALDPNNADGWFYKGLSLCRFGKWEDTLEPYDRAIELDPTNVVAMRNKADSLNNLGRHEEALQTLDIALYFEPTYTDALKDKGFALHALGRHEAAIAAYDKATKLNPNDDDSGAYTNKGVALKELGRHEEAIVAYDQALKLNPGNSNAFNNKGNALNALGRHEEAIVAYDQALKLNPGNSNAFYNKGVALNALGRDKEAIAAYDQALKLNPEMSEAFAGKGATLCALGKYKKASACFQQAMAYNPSDQVVRYIEQVKKHYHIS